MAEFFLGKRINSWGCGITALMMSGISGYSKPWYFFFNLLNEVELDRLTQNHIYNSTDFFIISVTWLLNHTAQKSDM